MSTRIVRRGDTLWKIARETGVRESELQAANGIADPDKIREGQVLEIPEPLLSSIAREQGWRLLTKSPTRLEHTVTGAYGTLSAGIDQQVRTRESQTYQQDAFQQEQAALGKDVVWVATGGNVSGKLANIPQTNGTFEAKYWLERPFITDAGRKEPGRLMKEMLANNTSGLPLNAEKAKKLERGSRFGMTGLGAMDRAFSFPNARVNGTGAGSASAEFSAEWAGDGKVEVRVDMSGELRGDSNWTSRDDRWNAGFNARMKEQRGSTVVIDLNTPEGAKAYDALVALRIAEVKHMAKSGTGVELSTASRESTREAGGRLAHNGDMARVGVSVLGRKTKTATETTRYREAAFSITDTRGGTYLTSSASGGISRTNSKNVDGSRRLDGRLYGNADVWLPPTAQGLNLGFSANGERWWNMRLPKDYSGDVPRLPLTAEAARALPTGVEFDLTGDLSLGGQALRERTPGAERDISLETRHVSNARLRIGVQRLDGEKVRLNAETVRHNATNARATLAGTHPRGERTLSIAPSVERDVNRSGSIELDLSEVQDRDLYNRLIRGDLDVLKSVEKPVTQETRSKGKGVEVTLSPIPELSGLVSLKRYEFGENDWRIATNPARSALSEKLKAEGKAVSWVGERGIAQLSSNLKGIAMGPVGVGFTAGQSIDYEVQRPRINGELQGSAFPALSVEAAKQTPAGTSFRLAGSIDGEVRAGLSASLPGRIGLSAELTSGRKATKTATLDASFLGENKVEVSYDNSTDIRDTYVQLLARAGVTFDEKLITSAKGKVIDKLLGGDALKNFEIKLDAGISREQNNSKRTSVVLNLDNADEAKAYEAFVRGDVSKARELQHARNIVTEQTRDIARAELSVFGEIQFLAEALRTDSTRIQTENGEVERTDRSAYEKRLKLFAHDRNVMFEATNVRTKADANGKTFFRITAASKDALTSQERLTNTVALAETLGLAADGEQKANEDFDRGLATILGKYTKYGKTTAATEMYVTQDGIAKLRGASDEQVMNAAAEFMRSRDHRTPTWASERAEKARELLDLYVGADQMGGAPTDNERRQGERDWASAQYYHQFRRSIYKDVDDYQHARSLRTLVSTLRENPDPQSWVRSFADHGEHVGYDFFITVSAINTLAGASEVLIPTYEMIGRTVRLKYTPRQQSAPVPSFEGAPSGAGAVLSTPNDAAVAARVDE